MHAPATPPVTTPMRKVPPPEAHDDARDDLARALRRRVEGEVRFGDGDRALYATDLSAYRQVPIGVVVPRTMEDVVETVAVCREHDVPVLARGGGTSLAGQGCNVAVVIDCSKYLNRILELNPEERYAWVEPGVICDQLRHRAWEHHLTWAPDPATHEYNTFGGMIGNNSCGSHSILGGKAVDNVEELDVLTYRGDRFTVGRVGGEEELERIIAAGGPKGEIHRQMRELRDRYADEIRARFPEIPRRVSGYNLVDLLPEKGFDVAKALVGAEGTLAIVVRAKVRLLPRPPRRSIVVLGYGSMAEAGGDVPDLLGLEPIALEGFHSSVPRNMERKGKPMPGAKLLPEGDMFLIVEFGGISQQEANRRAEEAKRRIEANGGSRMGVRIFGEEDEITEVWNIRQSGVASSRVAHEEAGWPGWEDSAVDPDVEADYLRDLEALLERYGYDWTGYGHWGQGCFHIRINFDFGTPQGVADYRAFMEEASDLVLSHGGSLSGEHGDGQARAEFLPRMFGDEIIEAFRGFKRIWDPDWKMNPGKVVDPYPMDTNLRVGPDYDPLPVSTHFRFPEDEGRIDLATQRCFGVGKCRRPEGGTMCPSFMVLREEKHTTRGRAHMLFEMLRGDVITDGWKSDAVKESLDLCLSCKGCKSDCPEAVDIATYKAEFLAHYYEGRPRPPSAYTLGLVPWWARIGGRIPSVANLLTRTPGLGQIARRAAGIAPERALPAFAPTTFRAWWRDRPVRNGGGPRVLLWPDTFNDKFHPETLTAGAEVLEAAGYQVIIPDQWLCCGRPLYDFGMLSLAKRQLRQIVHALRPLIRDGVPLVGLEPGCLSVFRDELGNLFPDDDDATRLAERTFTLGEFLDEEAGDLELPRLGGHAVVHGHCHHRAVLDLERDLTLLQRLGLDVEVPDEGCCGMAGSFGYEAGDRYDVSVARAEQALAPAVRDAGPDTLIVADGFSCRGQIDDLTDRHALHTAEVIQLALSRQRSEAGDGAPELHARRMQPAELTGRTSPLKGAAAVGGTALLAGIAAAGIARWVRAARNGG